MTDAPPAYNKYDRDYFPDDWGEEDFQALGKYVNEEFGGTLTRIYYGEWDFALYWEGEYGQ